MTFDETCEETIELDAHPHGVLTVPAVFDIWTEGYGRDLEGYACLLSFKVGARQFTREDAVAMCGAAEVERVEQGVFEGWRNPGAIFQEAAE